MITIQLIKQVTAAIALWRKSRNKPLTNALQHELPKADPRVRADIRQLIQHATAA
jgi:hypothetical protein